MKVKNEFIEWLIEKENPFPSIFSYIVKNIWTYEEDIKDFYKQGQDMNSFERILNDSYSELYTELLPQYCVGTDFEIDLDETKLIMMDSMSFREGILLQKKLEDEGFQTRMSYSFSAIPSDTQYFKSKISYNEENPKKMKINNPEQFMLEGDEDVVWSDFPDARLENIQKGRTVLSNTKDMYQEMESIVMNILRQHESDRFIISSDHGYTKSTGGYQFRANKEDLMKVRKVMSGSRYNETELNDKIGKMVDAGFLVYFNGYAMARGRYTWPIGGKYNVYQHGGVSLMECLTPKIEVMR